MAVKTFTTGEVLTAADTNTYLNNGGLVYVTSGTFTTAATVSLNNIFTASFTNYQLQITWAGSANSQYLQMRFRLAGVDRATAEQYGALTYQNFVGGTGTLGQNAQTSFNLGGSGDNANAVTSIIYRPALAARSIVTSHNFQGGGGVATQYVGAIISDTATAFDGVSFFATSGTITGSYTIYGFRTA